MTTQFQQRVLTMVRKIPEGKVTTYREIAHALGINSPRAIGQALKKNPDMPVTPCHRVVSSNGTIGGYAGQTKGAKVDEKIQLLEQEGVRVIDGTIQEFQKKIHSFNPDY
jgi:methylated-DNA-[protein]-cysteine S-methyltransferase